MKLEAQQEAIGLELGWRRWRFGDDWVIGLRLADQRFNGYVRRVIANADKSSLKVKLDIDETPTHDAEFVRKNFLPVSHWVLGKKISARLPDWHNDLNACHEMEESLSADQLWAMREHLFAMRGPVPIGLMCWRSTAPQRCESFLKTVGKWTNEDS